MLHMPYIHHRHDLPHTLGSDVVADPTMRADTCEQLGLAGDRSIAWDKQGSSQP